MYDCDPWFLPKKNSPVNIDKSQYFSSFVKVSPNPAKNYLNLTFEKNDYYSIRLYASDGRLVMSETTNSNYLQINTSALQNGIYFLSVSNEKNSSVLKVLIL